MIEVNAVQIIRQGVGLEDVKTVSLNWSGKASLGANKNET